MEKKIVLQYNFYDKDADVEDTYVPLLDAARKATEKSYAPYSEFKVGAAILLQNGEIVSGANQENASYPATLCAERITLGAVSSLYPHQKILAIAISYHKKDGDSFNPISPCGICRQVLAEFEHRQQQSIKVLLTGFPSDSPTILTPDVQTMLPFTFTKEDLH